MGWWRCSVASQYDAKHWLNDPYWVGILRDPTLIEWECCLTPLSSNENAVRPHSHRMSILRRQNFIGWVLRATSLTLNDYHERLYSQWMNTAPYSAIGAPLYHVVWITRDRSCGASYFYAVPTSCCNGWTEYVPCFAIFTLRRYWAGPSSYGMSLEGNGKYAERDTR